MPNRDTSHNGDKYRTATTKTATRQNGDNKNGDNCGQNGDSAYVKTATTIITTNLAAVVCVCVCVSVCKSWPISAHTLSFRIQTFRKCCSHSKIPIRCLWTALCVPLTFIVTSNNDLECKSSRFAAVVRSSVADKQLHFFLTFLTFSVDS